MKKNAIFIIVVAIVITIRTPFLISQNKKNYSCVMDGLAGEQPHKVCFLKDFLQNRSRFEKGDTQTAMLFYGPPGTGKTVTIQSIARETPVIIRHYSGASLITEWQNSGVKTIKDI